MPANLSHRHSYAERKAPKEPNARQDYEILDPAHRPDLHGEFAGAKVRRIEGNKQVVSLTEAQAKFYLDGGAIAPLNQPAPEAAKPEPAHHGGRAKKAE